MFYILISMLAGVIIVVSRVLNTRLSEKIGLIESSYFNYLTAALTSLILFIIIGENFSFSSLNGTPFYAYLGGFLGVIIVILNSVVTPKMSSFYVTLLVFIAQLFSGIAIDWMIENTLPLAKIIGGLFVVLGLGYNLYIDYLDSKKV